ncbi:MAG: TRAP transporter large permease subunit, partial [Dehalococcoidia bacterium]
VTTIPFVLADFVTGLAVPPMATMILIIIVYIVLGCFLEAMSMILLTVPIFFPLVQSLGFDLLWFGVLIVIVVELALITPPMGMTVYAVSGLQPDVPLTVIFKSVIPFIIASIFLVILLLFVPSLALFLPGMM